MNNEITKLEDLQIQDKIFTIRGVQVMLDRDLAELYEVETKVLNQAVKRNINRFPFSFRFQLTDQEKLELVTNCDHLQSLKFSSSAPFVFTEQGVAMLSAVLRSEIAVNISIQIIHAFIQMRKFITNNALIFQRMDKLEAKQLITDQKLEAVFKAIESKDTKPKQGIFYNGQIFDAYIFVSDLIKQAKKSIILIGNYIDETVLTLLTKRDKNCSVVIYTQKITDKLKLDLKKHNSQYPEVTIKEFKFSHDRFLILDNEEIYHIGASLKDLGNKIFAFSKMDKEILKILEMLD